MINHKKKTKIQFFFQKINHTRTWDCWQRPDCFHALFVSTGLTFRNKLSISGSTCTISKPKSNICHRCYITKFLCDLNKKIGVVKIKPPYLRFRICWEFTHSSNNFIAVRKRERRGWNRIGSGEIKRLSAADCEKCSSYQEGDLGCRAGNGGLRGEWGTLGVQVGGGVKGESYGTVLQHSKFLMKSAIGFQ